MNNKIMKTLTINGITYQVQDSRVDEKADKTDLKNLNDRIAILEQKPVVYEADSINELPGNAADGSIGIVSGVE